MYKMRTGRDSHTPSRGNKDDRKQCLTMQVSCSAHLSLVLVMPLSDHKSSQAMEGLFSSGQCREVVDR